MPFIPRDKLLAERLDIRTVIFLLKENIECPGILGCGFSRVAQKQLSAGAKLPSAAGVLSMSLKFT